MGTPRDVSKPPEKIPPPPCPYCVEDDIAAVYRASSAPWHGGRDYGPLWVCPRCDAYVGCHPNGKPLGRLANAFLRQAKIHAHSFLDALIKRKMEKEGCDKNTARTAGYRWLAQQMELTGQETHIGMFDVAQCERVVEICRPFLKTETTRRG